MVIRRIRPDRPYLCSDCATKRAILSAVSMATRTGEFYERHLEAQRKRRARERGTEPEE